MGRKKKVCLRPGCPSPAACDVHCKCDISGCSAHPDQSFCNRDISGKPSTHRQAVCGFCKKAREYTNMKRSLDVSDDMPPSPKRVHLENSTRDVVCEADDFELPEGLWDELFASHAEDEHEHRAPSGVMTACSEGNLSDLKHHVSSGVDIWQITTASGQNPLAVAAEHGQMEVLTWMAETWKLDFKARYVDGRTALMRPALYGHLPCVRWLVEKGVNPRTATKKGCTPLLSAAHSGDVPMLKYLSQFQPLSYTGEFGQTALHYAAANGHVSAVQWLCTQSGVDATMKSADGFTAMDLAERSGHIPVTEYLKCWLSEPC